MILDEKALKDNGGEFLAKFEKVVSSDCGGKIVSSEIMGKRQFAREIRKRKTGLYLDIVHEMEADQVTPLRNKFKLDDLVLRLQTYNYDKPE